MNKTSAQTLAKKGRGGDTQLGHLTPGEVVLPRSVMNSVPGLSGLIAHAFSMSDMDMKSYKVGDDDNNINPTTGLPEYDSEDSAGGGTESQGGTSGNDRDDGDSYSSSEDDDPGGNQGRDTPSRDFGGDNSGGGSGGSFTQDDDQNFKAPNNVVDPNPGTLGKSNVHEIDPKAPTPFATGYARVNQPVPDFTTDPVGWAIGNYLTSSFTIPGAMNNVVAGLADLGNKIGLPGDRYVDKEGNEYNRLGNREDWGEKEPGDDNEEGRQALLNQQRFFQASEGSGGATDPSNGGGRLPPLYIPYTEEQLGKGLYGLMNPGKVTYPGNTPYTSPVGYASGGLAGMFGGTLLPAAVGFGSSMMGLGPWAGAGLAGLTGYAMGGRNRAILDGVKGALAGYAGGSVAVVGGVAGAYDVTGNVPVTNPATGAATVTGSVPVAGPSQTMVRPPTTGFGDVMSTAGTNIANNFNANGMNNFALPLGALSGSLMLPSGLDSTGGGKGPAFASSSPATFKNEEERQAYLSNRRANSTPYTPFTDDQLGTNPDWYNSYSNPQPGYADGGRVGDLEKGSFVIPADVVSDTGDGNTEAGFAKLNTMFGGGYVQSKAMGGPIKGSTGGLDDLRQTTVEGSQAAAVSDGEYVVPRGDVARIGDGSVSDGSEKLYNFLKQIRMQKHGTSEQPKNTITMQGLRSMLG